MNNKSKINLKLFICVLVVITAFYGCKKVFTPKIVASPANYLVVAGIINAGADSTIIKLSRTVKLSQKVSSSPETGAAVTVESDGASITLVEQAKGIYASPALNLDKTRLYHLQIKTGDGEEYVSDAEGVMVTPPIDTVKHTLTNKIVSITTDTHDATNNTRYYRWEFTEDWRFNALYRSYFKVDGQTVVMRPEAEQIYSCFGNDVSSTILLGSSVNLSADKISNAPITAIDASTERLSIRYSMLLRQYALTKKAYDFWQELKKNSEQLGGIFDALPSQSLGNLHNTRHPGIPVIGYVSVSTVTSKRIYVDKSELLSVVNVYPFDCGNLRRALYNDPEVNSNTVNTYLLSGHYDAIPLQDIGGGFSFTGMDCADCTTRGVTKQPAFWRDH